MSIKVLLRTTHPKKDGTMPIIIRVIKDRKIKYISTGYSVNKNQFKDGLEKWVSRHPDAIIINNTIAEKRNKLLQVNAEPETHSTGNGITTIFQAVQHLLTQYEEREQVAAYNRLTTNLGYLKEAWGHDVKLSHLNKTYVDKYITYRIMEQKNGMSTIKKNLQDLATVLNNIEEYEGKNYFYAASKKIVAKPANRQSLTAAEVKAIENLKLDGALDVARDMWLFAFYAHGMRFESVALLTRKEVNGTFIRYQMNKGKKYREIEIHPKLQTLINKYKDASTLYFFPVIKIKPDAWTKHNIVGSANTMARVYFSRVCILAGIEHHVMFHTSRHTFANISVSKGVSVSVMKDALGHSNYATTAGYLKSLNDNRINDAIKDSGVFD